MNEPIEIEELVKILRENLSDDEINDDRKFKKKIVRMLRATSIATYYNYQQTCQIRKSINWLKYIIVSVILIIVIELLTIVLK